MKVCPRCGASCAAQTNPLAVAALVLGILSPVLLCCYGFGILPAVLAMIFGGIARGQIRRAGGSQAGLGLATAGLVLGITVAVLFVLLAVLLALSVLPSAYTHSMMPFSGSGIHI